LKNYSGIYRRNIKASFNEEHAVLLFQDGSISHLIYQDYHYYVSSCHPVLKAKKDDQAIKICSINSKTLLKLFPFSITFDWVEEKCIQAGINLQDREEKHMNYWDYIRYHHKDFYYQLVDEYLDGIIENMPTESKKYADEVLRNALDTAHSYDEHENSANNNNTFFIYKRDLDNSLFKTIYDCKDYKRASSEDLRLHAQECIKKGEKPWGLDMKYLYLEDGIFQWDSNVEDYVEVKNKKIKGKYLWWK